MFSLASDVRTGAEGTWSAAVADMQRHPRTVRIDGAYGSANHVRSSNVALVRVLCDLCVYCVLCV